MKSLAYLSLMKAFGRIAGLGLILSLIGSLPGYSQDTFYLYASRYPAETISADSVDCFVTLYSAPTVSPGTYYVNFGPPATLSVFYVNSYGKFTTSSNGIVSADGYSDTIDYTYYNVFQDWSWHEVNKPALMATVKDTISVIPQSASNPPIWTRKLTLQDYWYWDYQGSLFQQFLPDTWNIRPPLASKAYYAVSLPGVPQKPPDQSPPPNSCHCCGMAGYSFDQLRAGLIVTDTPISYQPALGSGISFTTTYNQRDVGQSGGPPVAGMGPLWTYSSLSYIINQPVGTAATVARFVPGGGIETYAGFQVTGVTYNALETQLYGSFAPERNSHAVLSWNPVTQAYTRSLPDGGYETYSQKVLGSGGTPYFLITSQADAQGNVVTYSYDSQNRISAITDATGKQTTFFYDNSNPLLITQVTDPFGRSATFSYDSQGRLHSATDPVGIVSVYKYDSTNFLNYLITPYGTTKFSTDSTPGTYQGVQATNPLNQTERVELRYDSPTGVSDTDTVPSAPGLLANGASGLSKNNSYYWDRRQYSSPLNYNHATITHWMNGPRGLTNAVDSIKKPCEGRVWYTYQGQTVADNVDDTTLNLPTVTARVLDDGTTTQASEASYTSTGLITQSIDPLGRTTNYTYAANGIDLTQVAQVNGSGQDVLSTMTYNAQHMPLSVLDASAQRTGMTYNSHGQLLSRTDAKGEITHLAYDSNNFLHTVTGPESGAVTSYTYDSVGRVHTVTDSEGYVVTTAYDNLDRPVTVTYPDGTTDQTVYGNLDVVKQIDRQGRVTANQYDAIRELVQTTDPLGRVTRYGWCTCGGLATLTDANGNVTTWNHDLQGRVTSKVYADSSQIAYAFETSTSRLHQMTDAAGNIAVYAYNADNTLASTTYTPASGVSATPNVSFTYDTVYNRVTGMTDGAGTTTYTYNAITGSVTTGAGRLAGVSVPIAGSTAAVTYSYDQLGRVTGRGVDAATTNANNVSTTFDDLGRVTNVGNALGAFTYAYVDTTSRLSEVTYPNGQKTDYSYFSNTGDQRLQEIKNYISGMISNTPLSKFDYTYNPVGTIATWEQQADSDTPTSYALSYDAADQLINAVQTNTSTSATVSSNAYNYDPSGNRLAETTSGGTTGGQFNNLNQLTGLSSSTTSTTVAGNTSAAVSSVTVNAVPATITSSTNFTANVPLPNGTNVVSVVAQPSSGTNAVTTKRYQIVNSGTAPTALTYDANGNTLTDENGNGYSWDALNRLTKITYASGATSNFAYDGLSRRISIIEKNSSGTVTSTKNYLWIGSEMAEERDASNTVTKRFFPQGEQQAGTNYYYTRDHLGSVSEMLNSSGTILSRYSYDPNGVTTITHTSANTSTPPVDATFLWDGMYWHVPSQSYETLRRIYRPDVAIWDNRDPLKERMGSNLYEFCANDPVNFIDPLGMAPNYDPSQWNDNGPYQNGNNCYSYACNWHRPWHPPYVYPYKPQPGEASGQMFSQLTCADIMAAARRDGAKDPDSKGCCPPGYHKANLYISPNDYHWYRQDSNGQWSSKPGSTKVTPQIPDPDPDADARGYTTHCGTLCVHD